MIEEKCVHANFETKTNIVYMEDTDQFMAEININCKVCGIPFQFLGLLPGLNLQGAATSPDGLELRIGISPQGTHPSPLDNLEFGIKGRLDG